MAGLVPAIYALNAGKFETALRLVVADSGHRLKPQLFNRSA
jgi:hypothetical protein